MGDGELVLVVEDNDKVREATVRRLESLGYAVVEAKTGPEAITLLKSGEPIAIVFSDIVMPGGMTGYDVAEWVQSMKPEVKVLMTSGYSDMPLAVSEAARKISIASHLSVPLSANDLRPRLVYRRIRPPLQVDDREENRSPSCPSRLPQPSA